MAIGEFGNIGQGAGIALFEKRRRYSSVIPREDAQKMRASAAQGVHRIIALPTIGAFLPSEVGDVRGGTQAKGQIKELGDIEVEALFRRRSIGERIMDKVLSRPPVIKFDLSYYAPAVPLSSELADDVEFESPKPNLRLVD